MSTPSKEPNVYKNSEGVWTRDGKPRETVAPLGDVKPSNIPGKSVVTVLITVPIGGASPPHTHHGAAVFASMLQGVMRNAMNDDEPFISHPGDHFYESPGCHHVLSENLSETEEAKFFASLIIDTEVLEKEGYGALVLVDADVEEKKQKEGKSAGGGLAAGKTAHEPHPPAGSREQKLGSGPTTNDSTAKPSFLKKLLSKFRGSS